MSKEKRSKLFPIISIILTVFIIVNFILYLAIDRYTFINWEYVYTPERADKFLIPAVIGLVVLILFSIVNIIIYYRQESKLPVYSIFRKLKHRQKTRNLKNEVEVETKIAIPPAKRKFSRFGMISEQLDLSQHKISVTTKDEKRIVSIDSLIYDEKILSERCGICKLTFNQGQLAVFCPQCETLFHKDHLKNWLQTTKHCPVCKYLFIN